MFNININVHSMSSLKYVYCLNSQYIEQGSTNLENHGKPEK